MERSNGARLRQRLARGDLLLMPSCPDPFAARIAEEAGFEAVALGGYAMGAGTTITEPLLTMSEVVELARRITQAVDVAADRQWRRRLRRSYAFDADGARA